MDSADGKMSIRFENAIIACGSRPVKIPGFPSDDPRLIDKAKGHGVKVIFVQPQFDARNAETIAQAIHGAVVSLDPLARDYLKNLRDMAAKVKKGISGPSQ